MRKYVSLAGMQARTTLAFRGDYLTSLVGLLLQVFLLRVVWTSVYERRETVADVALPTILAYVTLASVQAWLFSPWTFSLIPQRFREGRIGMDLVRPVGFITQVVAAQAGRTAAMTPFALLSVLFAVLMTGMTPPATVFAGSMYVVSLMLGYVVTTQLSIALGLITFWTLEIRGVFLIYRMVAQFMSGALMPLWFMPDPLRIVASALPFQAVTYTPTALYLGRLDTAGALRAVAVQVVWVLVLTVVTRWIWSRALHKVVVQGG